VGILGSAMLLSTRIDPGLPGRLLMFGYLWILVSVLRLVLRGVHTRSGIEVSFFI